MTADQYLSFKGIEDVEITNDQHNLSDIMQSFANHQKQTIITMLSRAYEVDHNPYLKYSIDLIKELH